MPIKVEARKNNLYFHQGGGKFLIPQQKGQKKTEKIRHTGCIPKDKAGSLSLIHLQTEWKVLKSSWVQMYLFHP